jgi:hypothetical protein
MKASLEYDLLKTDWIVYKCKNSDKYAQNLYAALCNNLFYKNDEEWSCSWRYAGGIVAEIRDDGKLIDLYNHRTGDYMDWYCSGIGSDPEIGYVAEGEVTSEIANDFLNLGWIVKTYEPLFEPGIYRNEWN